MTTLDQILAATRERIARAKERASVRPLEKAARDIRRAAFASGWRPWRSLVRP
jgi:hypothetical protein